MKNISLFTLVLCFICGGLLAQNPISDKTQPAWLNGTWERINTQAGKKAFEKWSIDKNEQLTGFGWTQIGKDTVFLENLKIVSKDEKLYYVADISHNAEPTYFLITSQSENGFVCENPAHDFPTKIEYQLNGVELKATISGKNKSILFHFRKVSD